MVRSAREMRRILAISIVPSKAYRRTCRMITVGRSPRNTQALSKLLQQHFAGPAWWKHVCGLVMTIALGHCSTIERLARLLGNSTHRTNHGECLWRSDWSESAVLQQLALATFRRLKCKNAGKCYVIIDDSQTLKRAKDGRRRQAPPAQRRQVRQRPHYCNRLSVVSRRDPLGKPTELPSLAIHNADSPKDIHPTVLFNAHYLCPVLADACQCRGSHCVGVGTDTPHFTMRGQKHTLAHYGCDVLPRTGQWCTVQGLRTHQPYRSAERLGYLNTLGMVEVVFSSQRARRHRWRRLRMTCGSRHTLWSTDYLKRLALQSPINDETQHCGPAEYRVLRHRAALRHLYLVHCAYVCLFDLALRDQRVQGQNKTNTVLPCPPASRLKTRMRQLVWRERIVDVVTPSHHTPVLRHLEQLMAA